MCGSQTDWNTARILVFLESFDVLSGIWYEFDVMCFSIMACAYILGHIRYIVSM